MNSTSSGGAPNDLSACTLATCPVILSKIGYIPNLAGNAFMVAWFSLMLLAQLALSIRYKTWSHLVGQFIGLVLEIVGYAARVKLHDTPFNDKQFITYIITITIAPAFLCYTIYLCFGRIVIVYGTQLSLIPFRAYTIIFVTTDVICLLLQAAGAAWTQAKNITPADLNKAINVLKAGLGMQVASLGIFVVLSVDLTFRLMRKRSLWSTRYVNVRDKKSFKLLLAGAFVAAVLILIRSAYRIQELDKGFTPPKSSAQALFMVFEGAMIGLASLILVIVHPGPSFGPAWKATSFFSKQTKGEGTIAGNVENGGELDSGMKTEASVPGAGRQING